MLIALAVVFIVLKLTAVIGWSWTLVLIPVDVLAAIWTFQLLSGLASYGVFRKIAKKIDKKW